MSNPLIPGHAYTDKFPVLTEGSAEPLRDLEILRFFESLNQVEWRDLLRDLASDSSYISSLFALRVGEDVVSYFATLLAQLAQPTRKHVVNALDSLVIECIAQAHDPSYARSIKTNFFLAKVLEEGIKPDLLIAIVKNEAMSQDVRQDAAAVLANLRDPLPHTFWINLNFTSQPFLATAAIAAVAESQPLLALDILSHIHGLEEWVDERRKDFVSALKFPVRATLKSLRQNLKEEELLIKAQQKVDGLSPFLKEYIVNLPLYKDLFPVENSGRPAASGILKQVNLRNAWKDLVEQVISTRKLPYYYTGYQQANVFRRDYYVDESEIESRFLDAIRDEIKESANKLDVDIILNRLEIYSLNKLVNDLVEGKAILPEVGYGTRIRGEKAVLVRVGQIEQLAALVPQHLSKKFEISLDIDVERLPGRLIQNNIPDLEQVLDVCMDEKIQWINQPNSAVAEVAGDLFDKKMLQPGRTNVPASFPGGVEDPDWIKDKLIEKGKPRHLALVDFLTAKGIKRKAGKRKLELYSIKYNTPLPVGYFTPKGDQEFLTHILRAINKTLFDPEERTWNKSFAELMSQSLVILDPEPSIQVYSSKDSGWVLANELVTQIAKIA